MSKIKRFAKKVVAAVLAALFAFGGVPYFGSTSLLLANPPGNVLPNPLSIEFDFDRVLGPGFGASALNHSPSWPVPPASQQNAGPNQLQLSWPLNTTLFPTSSYRLTFPMMLTETLPNGDIITVVHHVEMFLIRTSNTTAWVTYRVFANDPATGNPTGPPLTAPNLPPLYLNIGTEGANANPNYVLASNLPRAVRYEQIGTAMFWGTVSPGNPLPGGHPTRPNLPMDPLPGGTNPALNPANWYINIPASAHPNHSGNMWLTEINGSWGIGSGATRVEIANQDEPIANWVIDVELLLPFYQVPAFPDTEDPPYHRLFMGMTGPGQTPVTFPFFAIEIGTGFSFAHSIDHNVDQNAAHSVHFLWTSGNDFVVTLGGFAEGIIFPFNLQRYTWDPGHPDFPGMEYWYTGSDEFPGGFNFNNFVNNDIIGNLTSRPNTERSQRRVFTGLVVETRPLARHRERPRWRTLNVEQAHLEPGSTTLPAVWQLNRDPLFYLPPPSPAPGAWGSGTWPGYPEVTVPPPWNMPNLFTNLNDPRFFGGFTNWNLQFPWGAAGEGMINLPGHPNPIPRVHNLFNHGNVLSHIWPLGSPHPLANDNDPGDETMLVISVQRPLEWVGAGSMNTPSADTRPPGFRPQRDDDDAWQGLLATVTLHNNSLMEEIPDLRFFFDVNNFFGSAPTPPTLPVQGMGIFVNSTTTALDIVISDVPHSQIFSADLSNIAIESGPAFPADVWHALPGTPAGLGPRAQIDNAYTFMRFWIEFHGGENRWHVRLAPYLGHPGTYWLLQGAGMPPSIISAPVGFPGVLTGDYLFLPIEIPPRDGFGGGGLEERIQILFVPNIPPVSTEGIFSQVMDFRGTPDRTMFTTPNNFTIDPTNPPLRLLNPSNPDEAVFRTTMGWDIAEIGAIAEYFDFINRPHPVTGSPNINEIRLRYTVRSRLTPFPPGSGLPDPYDEVMEVDIRIIRQNIAPPGSPPEWIFFWEYEIITGPEDAGPTPPEPPATWWEPHSIVVRPLMQNGLPHFMFDQDSGHGYIFFEIDVLNSFGVVIPPANLPAGWALDWDLNTEDLTEQQAWHLFDVFPLATPPVPPIMHGFTDGVLPMRVTPETTLFGPRGLETLLNRIADPTEPDYDTDSLVLDLIIRAEQTGIPLLNISGELTLSINLTDFYEAIMMDTSGVIPWPPTGGGFEPIPTPPLATSITVNTQGGVTELQPGQSVEIIVNFLPTDAVNGGLILPWQFEDQFGNPIPVNEYNFVLGEYVPNQNGVFITESSRTNADGSPFVWPAGTQGWTFTIGSGLEIGTILTGRAWAPAVPVPVSDTFELEVVRSPHFMEVNPADRIMRVEVPLSSLASRRHTLPSRLFSFPEIYHLTVSLTEIRHGEAPAYPAPDSEPVARFHDLESVSAPLTLDRPDSMNFPSPQDLRLTVRDNEADTGNFDIRFLVPGTLMERYINQSIYLEYAMPQIRYRVLISEDPMLLLNIPQLRQLPNTPQRNFLEITGHNRTVQFGPTGEPLGLTEAQLSHLRGQGVLWMEMPMGGNFTNYDFILPLTGLDLNRRYYVVVDSFIYFPGQEGSEPFPNPHFSHTTNIGGVTTHDHLREPDPEDFAPASPGDLRADEVLLDSATLSWLPVPPFSPAGTIRYEVVRVRGRQVPPGQEEPPVTSVLDRTDLSIAQVIAQLATLDIGVDAAVRVTDGGPVVAIPGTGTNINHFNFAYGADGRARLVNTNLAPNTLYFYYVRTVWEVNGSHRYSTWNGISVTTDIVNAPINLRVELAPWILFEGETSPRLWMDFDPRNQTVIRFDAPVASPEGQWDEWEFEFSLRQDLGEWAEALRLTRGMMLGVPERTTGLPADYPTHYTFTFLISNLLPGRQYSIRVRTFDLINHDFSQYSNIATTRTDTDQDTIDRERDEENLTEYLRELIGAFGRRHYWVAQNRDNLFSILYRPTMINNLLETNDSMIRLAMSDMDVTVFYLPQALFLEIWRSEQGLIIQRGDMEIAIPHRAFNDIDSEAIIAATRRIRDVREVVDYYVRLTVMARPFGPNTMIHGLPPAGSELSLRFEVVEANMTARMLDIEIGHWISFWEEHDYFIEPHKAEIGRMLDRGESFEFMTRRLRQIAEAIEHQMAGFVNSQLLPTLGRTYEVRHVSQPVTIRINNQPTSSVVSGFQFAEGMWVRQDIQIQGNSRILRTNVTGAFAFNVNRLALPGLTNMQGHETLTALIVRYGLSDFLGNGDTFMLNSAITLNALQGVAARLAGAETAANPQNWLRSRGYIVPVRGASSPATMQEAIYTIMIVYEMRSGTSVEAVRISNFNRAGSLNGIDQRYRASIAAAFELNIFTNTNMNPNGTASVEDVLRMILAVHQRVGLN